MKQIEKARKDLGLSVEELAELLGASVGTVRNWSSTDELPQWAVKSIAAQVELKTCREFKAHLRNFLDSL